MSNNFIWIQCHGTAHGYTVYARNARSNYPADVETTAPFLPMTAAASSPESYGATRVVRDGDETWERIFEGNDTGRVGWSRPSARAVATHLDITVLEAVPPPVLEEAATADSEKC